MSYPGWLDHCDEDFAQSWGGWDAINGGDPRHSSEAIQHQPKRLLWPCRACGVAMPSGKPCINCFEPEPHTPASATSAKANQGDRE